MLVYVFVDYDNVKPIRKELGDDDVLMNLVQISEAAITAAKDRFSSTSEVVLRLYGGWTDVLGAPSEMAVRLYRNVPKLLRRSRGLRVTTEIVVAPIGVGGTLKGLWRSGAQKMVDTMLTADLVWCALSLDVPLIVMSNDDDMLPGVVTSAIAIRTAWDRNPVCLCRPRNSGDGLNDPMLLTSGVHFMGVV